MSALRLTLVLWALLLPIPTATVADPGPVPEPVRWLHEYLQIDTTNPPGNEREAAELLAAILEREGIAHRLLESPSGRTSLYARLEAPGSGGRGVALLHHIDVVPAVEEVWRVDPFSGRPYEGKLWGRGALDVKGLGIAELAAVVSLVREGAPIERDVVYLAVADEESGGGEGVAWLLEEHPELFEGVEAVLNEGGYNRVLGDRLIWWGVEVSQKRPLWLRVTARGRGGHGSTFNPGSATHQLIRGLARLLEMPMRYRVTPPVRTFLGALAELEGGGAARLYHELDEVIQEDGPTRPLQPGLPGLFVDTVQVTAVDNGEGLNVVVHEASASIDVRLLPDTDADAFLAEVREALGDDLEVEVLLDAPEVAPSPTDHPVYRTLEETLGVRAPVVPVFISGTTDSRYFRQRGIAAYGIWPFAINPGDLRGIHAVDEAIPVDAFLRGVETVRRIIRGYALP